MNTEDSLIRRIARAVPSQVRFSGDHGLLLGIGDDAAVLDSRSPAEWVVSCDAFVEDVHFLAATYPPDSVGYKAVVRAASDLVAMGAEPRLFLMTLALPAPRTGHWLDQFLRGMKRAARYLDMQLAGGDTTTGAKVGISVTVLGQIERGPGRTKRAMLRSGARPGDQLYVTGRLGRAALGLALARRGCLKQHRFASLLEPHLYPRLRVELARWLRQNRIASAMMDLSDGLSSDLARLCRASRVGAKVWACHIPGAPIPAAALRVISPRRAADPLPMALDGGDDYELLFTVPPENVDRLCRAPEFAELTRIGEIIRGRRVLLLDTKGKTRLLRAAGWDPFRS